MLLVDMSNLVFSSVTEYHNRTGEQIKIDTLRHMTLTNLKALKDKLSIFCEDGMVVLCFDGKTYWRREEFKHYKGRRKINRDKATLDWDALFIAYAQLKEEIKESLPLYSLTVDGAEADDLIAVLATRFASSHKICIASSDTDFIQLQLNVNKNIKQWSLYHKKFITPKNEKYDLFEHILRGDTTDGVPNILSDDDTFMDDNKRQKQMRQTKIDLWRPHGIAAPEKFCEDAETLKRFERNKKLIDLREIPEHVAQKIVDEFDNLKPVQTKVFGYLVAHRLTGILKQGQF